MLIIALVYGTWSPLWVLSLLFQEANIFQLDPDDQYEINLGLSLYHLGSIFLTLIFYYQHHQQLWKHLKFTHYEPRFWLFLSVTAAIANIAKNLVSSSQGYSNAIFFWPATIQNVLVYIASMYCILILDGWNMDGASTCIKCSVYILIASQTIIIGALLAEIIYSYTVERSSLYMLLLATFFRLWLMYFGWKQITFLYRKTQRWNYEIFIHSICFAKLQEESDASPPRVLLMVCTHIHQAQDLISPPEMEHRDLSGTIREGSYYYVRLH